MYGRSENGQVQDLHRGGVLLREVAHELDHCLSEQVALEENGVSERDVVGLEGGGLTSPAASRR